MTEKQKTFRLAVAALEAAFIENGESPQKAFEIAQDTAIRVALYPLNEGGAR